MTRYCNRCFECNEELSTHCNKKALAQTLDFLQKHSVKVTSGKVFSLSEVWPPTVVKKKLLVGTCQTYILITISARLNSVQLEFFTNTSSI